MDQPTKGLFKQHPQHSNQQAFQQQQQSDSQNNDISGNSSSLSSSCSSPRRRKPTLNIDTALYLQSQASYVQEPANKSNPHNQTAVATTAAAHQQQRQQQQRRPQIAGCCCAAAAAKSSKLPKEPFYKFNISVDYIDCLANTDLTQQSVRPASFQPLETNDENNMRCLPSCGGRRHFSRFHRAHRIEPTLAEQQPTVAGPTSDTSSLITTNSLSGDQTNSSSIDQQQQQQQQQESTSVLSPISVSEVKKRTYLIGSVSQDSLLGQDELIRYFPQGRVNIFVCTWNQNRKRTPTNLNDLLLPDRLVLMPDIYAIGIQEAFSSQADYLREWDIELQTTLGPNHVLLHSCSLGVLHLSIFVRRDLIWFCSTPEESLYNSRSMPTNMIKTKGAVSIAFRFFGTSFMFTNCHFPAHENKLRDRIEEYQRIINSIDLPKNLKLLKPRYLSNDSTARFDCVFFMGDLNFRLEQRTFDETIQILDDIFHQQSAEQNFEILTQNDELLKVMESQQAFHGFDEAQIKFPPTYKFLAQTNKYDKQTKRVPSYTDRILFRSKRQRHIQCLIYDWLPQLLSSDHKPVYCLFDVLIRPGREQNLVGSLNAGMFQRAIYLEALKRRAEDADGMGRENGVGGNLICSIT